MTTQSNEQTTDDDSAALDSISSGPRRLLSSPIAIALLSIVSTLFIVLLVVRVTTYDNTPSTDATQQSAEDGPQKASQLVLQAVDLINNKNYTEAIKVLTEAGELDPANPLVFYNIGVAQHFSNDLVAAEASYGTALSVDNRLSSAYYNRGLIRRDQGKLREAVADLQVAAALKSDNAAAHFNLGQVLKSLGDTKAAEAALAKARELNPDIGK